MTRLSAPYGDCIMDGRTSSYIYDNYDYTTEGCFRSCFQGLIVAGCKCGDPRSIQTYLGSTSFTDSQSNSATSTANHLTPQIVRVSSIKLWKTVVSKGVQSEFDFWTLVVWSTKFFIVSKFSQMSLSTTVWGVTVQRVLQCSRMAKSVVQCAYWWLPL